MILNKYISNSFEIFYYIEIIEVSKRINDHDSNRNMIRLFSLIDNIKINYIIDFNVI